MAGNDLMLAGLWKGLNRRVAPYLLPESQSPDTTDAGSDLNVIGLLGPRKGRTRIFNRAFNIMGVGSANFPWGRQRVVVTDDGTWENFAVPWPAALTPAAADIVDLVGGTLQLIDAGTITQIGAGTTTSADFPVSPTISIGQFNGFRFNSNHDPGIYNAHEGNVITNTLNSDWSYSIQLKIDGVYTTVYVLSKAINNVTEYIYYDPVQPTVGGDNIFDTGGTLSAFRIILVNGGAGTVTARVDAELAFTRNTQVYG